MAVALGEIAMIEKPTSQKRDVGRQGLWLTTLLVLGWGAIEGWFGRTEAGDVYGSDAVQYLDIARAMARGDWHSALNPLWSQGYPRCWRVCGRCLGWGRVGIGRLLAG